MVKKSELPLGWEKSGENVGLALGILGLVDDTPMALGAFVGA
jgi:hypothetical protein